MPEGVPPSAIVSYHRALAKAGADLGSFHKLVEEYGGVEAVLAARRKDLEGLMHQVEGKGRTLAQLKAEEARVRESIIALREIESLVGSAKAEVKKLCRGLHEDITRWGEVRAEMGKSREELKLARYFAKLPLSEEALSGLVEEIGTPVVLQYLIAALTWCRKKFNPKLRLPAAMIKKYYRIADYTEVELADILMWALLMLMGGQ